MGLFKNYVSQTRKPEGTLGKMMIKGMNSGHAKMADWGLAHLKKTQPERIAELVQHSCHLSSIQFAALYPLSLLHIAMQMRLYLPPPTTGRSLPISSANRLRSTPFLDSR